ncbi:hypothetical protein ACU8KH_01595 [Lachancea thermotolerans]
MSNLSQKRRKAYLFVQADLNSFNRLDMSLEHRVFSVDPHLIHRVHPLGLVRIIVVVKIGKNMSGTRIEPVSPPWKGGMITTTLTALLYGQNNDYVGVQLTVKLFYIKLQYDKLHYVNCLTPRMLVSPDDIQTL